MSSTELILIRHGQSEGNVGRSSDPDCALTDVGVQQARDLGRRLARLDLCGFTGLVSPYRRAVHTASEITLTCGLTFAKEEAVREWGPTATVGGRTYELEPVPETVRRLTEFLRQRRGQRLVIVSHAAPIALLTHLAWGETPVIEGEFWLGVANCCPRWVKSLS